jgi:prophage antirepressor-like protein
MATKMKKSSNKVNNVTNKQQEIVQAKVSKTVNSTTSTATSSPLQTFSNSEFGDVRVIMQDDEPWFVGKDVADSLDYQNGSRDINRHVAPEDRTKEMVFDGNQRKETILINESGLYSLILSSKLPSAKKFKRWVTSEVLPTIRKTGGYVDENRSDLFLDTYLPFADDTTRTLFKSTLDVINSQNEMIRQKNQEISEKTEQIDYQTNVIHGLTKDIPTADMRHILNRILRNNHGKFERRWMVLYREFDNIYKFDTRARYENYMISGKKPKVKNRLDYIDKVLNMLPQLFDVATKLFESDVNELVQQMYDVRKEDDEDAWMDEL